MPHFRALPPCCELGLKSAHCLHIELRMERPQMAPENVREAKYNVQSRIFLGTTSLAWQLTILPTYR